MKNNNEFSKWCYQILGKTLILATLSLIIASCNTTSETASSPEVEQTSEVKQKKESKEKQEVKTDDEDFEYAEDLGDIFVFYEETDDDEFEEIREVLEDSAYFDDIVADLNESLAFPNDIDVIFTSCGESNAYYYPEEITITMCYELIAEYMAIFEIETDEDFENEVIDASSFTFFHEIGHALVDQYDLPITGNEEDAVDNFASIILLDLYEDDLGVISGMFQFEADSIEEQENLEDLAYWGEHSLNSQRFYNTACLIYGSDPDEFEFILEEEYLPEDRAQGCEEEYEQKSDSWWTLIEPFIKE